ncbi:sulfatase-like hydrolase/transferase [Paenibacillus sp. 1P07SE]|uniref:sulfatase-like hydrolase/transferase n=1 Tax=Paenibacillus sp. 1P07SE TaxID=3132209 RepID=UPI0039A47389
MNKQPNIIYILDDDHRAEMLGCAGYPVLKTPHLDQLAREGVRFTEAFCTSPVCTPSRCSHYLGQWERRHGVNFNSESSLAQEAWETSFPMQLKQQGYYVGWVGKNHVPAGDGGYESGYLESAFDYWYGNHGHSGFYVKELERGKRYQQAAADTQVEVFEEGALRFLELAGERPFCLCVTFNLPHSFGTQSMELRETDDALYVSAYRDQMDQLPLPDTYIPYEDISTPRLPKQVYNGRYLASYDYVKTPEALRERQIRMLQTITGIDRMVGKLRTELERRGLADDTIIVFSSDHGIHLGEHGLGGKCFLYEEDLRIPLIVFDPRLPEPLRGRTLDPLVVVPDLAPTMLELAGLSAPSSMQGSSLRPWIYGESPDWREDFMAEQLMDIQNYPKSECIRTRQWKYIRYFDRTEDPEQEGKPYRGTLDSYDDFLLDSAAGKLSPVYEELYHLSEDPGERLNLAGDPSCSAVLEQLRRRLAERISEARGDRHPPLTLPLTAGRNV